MKTEPPNYFPILLFLTSFFPAFLNSATAQEADSEIPLATYSEEEVLTAARDFFGPGYEALPRVISKAFDELGEPTSYVTGTEGPGEVVLGYRYGSGTLHEKGKASSDIYWRGPAIGFDLVPEDTKLFILVYNLHSYRSFYKRYPSGEDEHFVEDGIGMSYKTRQRITLAIIRNWEGTQYGLTPGWIKFDDDPMVQPSVVRD